MAKPRSSITLDAAPKSRLVEPGLLIRRMRSRVTCTMKVGHWKEPKLRVRIEKERRIFFLQYEVQHLETRYCFYLVCMSSLEERHLNLRAAQLSIFMVCPRKEGVAAARYMWLCFATTRVLSNQHKRIRIYVKNQWTIIPRPSLVLSINRCLPT